MVHTISYELTSSSSSCFLTWNRYESVAEDSLNVSLREITLTGRDGRVSQLEQVYIRGSMIRYFIVPDMLQNAPMYVLFRLLVLTWG